MQHQDKSTIGLTFGSFAVSLSKLQHRHGLRHHTSCTLLYHDQRKYHPSHNMQGRLYRACIILYTVLRVALMPQCPSINKLEVRSLTAMAQHVQSM